MSTPDFSTLLVEQTPIFTCGQLRWDFVHIKTHFYILHTPWKTSPLPFYSGLKSSRGCEISDRTEGTGTANVCAHNKKQTKCHKKDGYRGSTTISLLSKLGVPLYTEVGLSAQIMLLGDSGKALLPDHDKWVGLAFVGTFLHLKAVILDLIQPSPSQHCLVGNEGSVL